MILEFSTTKLAKKCETAASRQRAFGQERGKKLGARLTALVAAPNLEVLSNAPGRLHAMVGDRAGQYSLDLDGPYRLYFEPVLTEEESRDNPDGLSRSQITHVRILSIEDPHGR